jgi:hypothetical protein
MNTSQKFSNLNMAGIKIFKFEYGGNLQNKAVEDSEKLLLKDRTRFEKAGS